MRNKASNHRYAVSEAYVIMMSGKNFDIEDLIRKLFEVLKNVINPITQRTEYAPAMFACAILKYMDKKETEAKNFLKMISKQ